ncbi:MAG: B12-binding domain-containing radical SAM protein [Nitrospirae bacterium]|nr:B12-binding domain-containing radical SAM protein [Nitrospirota bacterium]
MKVLLIYPNIRGMNMLPPAIALFSSILKEQGHKVSLFDATDYPNIEDNEFNSDKLKEKNLNVRPFDDTLLKITFKEDDLFESYKRHVEEFSPGLIAMSTTEDMFPIGIRLLGVSHGLGIPTLVGGVFATFAPELLLNRPEVDMVCVGEGEHVIKDLCARMDKAMPYDDIPGLWIKRKNEIRRNPMGQAVDMNENPLLDLSIFPEGRLYRPMQGRVWRMFPLETHRGCPYQCTYCNSPSQTYKYREETGSRFFRKKRLDKIRTEIIHFRDKYNAEAFYFWADTFFAYSEAEFDAFVEMYSEFKIPFWCQTRPETVTYKRVKKLSEVGMFRMAFGIEHGNEDFRKRVIHRSVKNETIIKALATVNDVGVPYSVNNILGFPFETRELSFDTIDLNRHINPDSMNAYSFSPFHGTPLRKIAEQQGYIAPGTIARSVTRPTLLNMPQFTPAQIEGVRRCFVIYTKLPKSRWPEIEKAEKLTPEGDAIWETLRDEVAEKYMPHGDEENITD